MTLFILLGIAAAFCIAWLILRAAAYALPVYAGVWAALHLAGAGHGYATAVASGLGATIAIFLFGRLLAQRLRSAAMRLLVMGVFAIPASAAGCQAGRGLGCLLIGEGMAAIVVSALSGLVAATSAWRSLAVPVGPARCAASQGFGSGTPAGPGG